MSIKAQSAIVDNLATVPSQLLAEVFPQGFVVFDTETTGLSPLVDNLIEIAAVKWMPTENGGELSYFSELINPLVPIPENTILIHGITDDMVSESRTISQVLPEFLDFVGPAPLVAHNSRFDMGFVMVSAGKYNLSVGNKAVYCTCQMAKRLVRDISSHKLILLCEYFDITLENHHRALDDAKACFDLFIKLMTFFVPNEPKPLNAEALRAKVRHGYLFESQDFGDLDTQILPNHLQDLSQFVRAQQMVEIKYKGGTHKGQYRPVRPTGLLPLPGGPAMYGLCLLSNLYKYFSLSKIQEIRKPSQQKHQEYLNNLNLLREQGSEQQIIDDEDKN
jgi:DNA polymerase-3 subunit epsilon